MRILMLNHEFTITGASTVLFRLATHLQAAGHDITLFACLPGDGPMKRQYEDLGIPVVKDINIRPFDLAIANTICAANMVMQTGPHLKTIWFLHETEIGLQILLKTPELAGAFEAAAAVVYQTEYQREIYRSFTYQLDRSKFHIIANGVDAGPALAAVPGKTRALRVVQVGTIEPRKRTGDLIRAVATSGLDIECVICGKFFQLEADARKLVKANPEMFRLNGETPQAETMGWVASADVFCLASSSESQPVSVFEAAALARPLLLSDLPAYAGVFSHGRNCLMFPPRHVELLALSLGMYAGSATLRAEMGAGAQATARRFSSGAFFEKFDAVIRRVTSTD